MDGYGIADNLGSEYVTIQFRGEFIIYSPRLGAGMHISVRLRDGVCSASPEANVRRRSGFKGNRVV
jgi:hypothetical protein